MPACTENIHLSPELTENEEARAFRFMLQWAVRR